MPTPHSRIPRNVMMSVAEVFVTGVVFFFLLRYVLLALGPDRLGLWAILAVVMLLGQLGAMGMPDAMVKFVADHLARRDRRAMGEVMVTAVATTAVSTAVILAALYPLAHFGLWALFERHRHDPTLARLAVAILPWAMVTGWVAAVGRTVLAGLDGLHRVDLRSAAMIVNMVLILALTYALVPSLGLLGVVVAHLAAWSLVTVGGWALLLRLVPGLPWVLWHWRRERLRQMLRYTLAAEGMQIAALLLEPITKVILTIFGGTAATGYYEMASRLIAQMRKMLVQAARALVPAFADLYETDRERLHAMFRLAQRTTIAAALPVFATLAATTPIIGEIWIGHREPIFNWACWLLILGWLCNVWAIPAFFANFGTGHMRGNLICHTAMTALNLALGVALGAWLGKYGVMAAFAISLAVGSAGIPLTYIRRTRLRLRDLWPAESWTLTGAAMAATLMGLFLYHTWRPNLGLLGTIFATAVVLAVTLGPALWLHPLRKRLMARQPAGNGAERPASDATDGEWDLLRR